MFLDRNCGCGYTPMFNNQMPTPEIDLKDDMQEMPGLDNMDPNMYQNACGIASGGVSKKRVYSRTRKTLRITAASACSKCRKC